jgi:hypothetical protein
VAETPMSDDDDAEFIPKTEHTTSGGGKAAT